MKVWHGETNIASYDFVGGYREVLGPRDAMFDNQYGLGNIYHSTTCTEERGININFLSEVQYIDLEIHTRRDCCADRYSNICLYMIDGEAPTKQKVACTPSNLGDLGSKGTLKMKDFNLTPSEVFGTQFQLRFEDTSGGDKGCGQIEELFFHYKEAPGKKIVALSCMVSFNFPQL